MEQFNNNPYNFVSLCEKVFERYASMDELPKHGTIEPGHFSGEIECTLTAETKVCVSDGNEGFFKGANGHTMIPGSSLKGLVRTNMMILGFGAMRPEQDFNDIRFLYRSLAAANSSVRFNLKGEYKQLAGNAKKPKAKAGYLVKVGEEYEIHPAKYSYIPLKKRDKNASVLVKNNKSWVNAAAAEFPVYYELDSSGSKVTLISTKPTTESRKGYLLAPGDMNKQNTLYLITEESDEPPIPWKKADRLAYEMDYYLRKNSLGETKRKKMDPSFWELPKDQGQPWPIFYISYGEDSYVIGKSLFPRMAYKYTTADGLPDQHRKAADDAVIDYPWAILGFTTDETAYRSRVSFGDFEEQGQAETTLQSGIQASPKPTSFADYLMPDENGKAVNYNSAQFRIRGIKQYWLHEEQELTTNGNIKAESRICTLPKQTKFKGKIRFRNLAEDELGLLLWSVGLSPDCYHTLGMGKALGFGRMKPSIDAVRILSPEGLYGTNALSESGYYKTLTKPDVEELVEKYKEYIPKCCPDFFEDGKGLVEQQPIREFDFLHRCIQDKDDVRYMTLDEYQNRKKGLPLLADELYRSEK